MILNTQKSQHSQMLDTTAIVYVNMKFEGWSWRDMCTCLHAQTYKGEFPHVISRVVGGPGHHCLAAYSVVLW